MNPTENLWKWLLYLGVTAGLDGQEAGMLGGRCEVWQPARISTHTHPKFLHLPHLSQTFLQHLNITLWCKWRTNLVNSVIWSISNNAHMFCLYLCSYPGYLLGLCSLWQWCQPVPWETSAPFELTPAGWSGGGGWTKPERVLGQSMLDCTGKGL